MQKFMVDNLLVPLSLLEEARDLIVGGEEAELPPPPISPQPIPMPKHGPKASATAPNGETGEGQTEQQRGLQETAEGMNAPGAFISLEAFSEVARRAGQNIARRLGEGTDEGQIHLPSGGGGGGRGDSDRRISSQTGGPTDAQRERGRQGEELVLERLGRGDWKGWSLVRDRRQDGCGYDFEVETPKGERRLEVKTAWFQSGEVSFTWKELETAFEARSGYRLLIVEADDRSPEDWSTFYRDDPVQLLRADDVKVEMTRRLAVPLERLKARQEAESL